NLYQLRLVTAAGSNQDPQYQVADVLVSGNTWTQVYPAVKANTVTTLTAAPNPANLPAGSGTSVSVTLTANVASGGSAFTAGTVQFKNGSTNIGSPVAVDSTGKASTTATFTSTGTFPLSAVFTPTDTTSYNGSTGTTSEVVTQATSTFTSLSVVQDGTAGDDVMLTANVTSGSPAAPFGAGTVAFYDNGSSTALGTGTQGSTGAFTLDLPTGLAAGSHSIVARFTPTDTATYAGSQSSAQAFVLSPKAVGACATTGSVCNDTQNIQVTVPVGTLVISTPYTSANPLDLKTMALDPSAKYLTASAGFEHIQVTDQRSGNLPYTVTASASNLSDGKSNAGSTIDAHDVGLTGLAKTSSSNLTGAVTFTDAPAANLPVAPGASSTAGLGGAGAPVISVDHGFGFLEASGTLTINAPITTEPGLFTGTITFTVG
ncbi:MAG: Ig-like domain-containing protein, partial [Jatrophihabitans sp.]|uniref:Ig-like domain-containing protein n=1 Tax=Jatrophihabitans sp. TaxID=1932789 RepID=UPI003F80F4CB